MTTRLPAPQRQEIEKALHAAATDPNLKPPDRAELADILDQFYQPTDLYAFIKIEAQPIAFYISRYPVTNAQYERFLQAENFGNPNLWSEIQAYSELDKSGKVKLLKPNASQGWEWLQTALKNDDYLVENGVLYPRYWRDLRFGVTRPHAPVVGVSWWEANAYCKWLLAHWDELEESRQGMPKPRLIRLPNEPEWVLAAGGKNPERRYAWDREKTTSDQQVILQRANIYESAIRRTTPVWMYPLGASPDGVMDMSGNIWEWQANYANEKEGWMGLRGGSWLNSQVIASVAFRDGSRPDGGDDLIGFRVVSPPD